MMRLGLILVVGSIIIQLCSAQQPFLQNQLPLKVLVTTPSELASDAAEDRAQAVTLTGRQAITAVFSRPVIALGSDWGSKELPDSLVPFTLSCKTPGRFRWVTTNIARFDPSIDWPTDLDCSFDWNKALKAYDGATLQLGSLQPSVRLQTTPLTMNVQQVQSEAAMAATGGQWSAFLGSPDDRLPEVPPDANLTLSFSYPVELAQLAKSLKVAGSGAGGRTITVSPCMTPRVSPWPVPLVFTASGIQNNAAAGSSPADLLKLNSTCAVIKIVPGLEPGAAAVLRLPKGARYSPVAGPVATDTDVNVYGLRPFRIPLRWDFTNISNIKEDLYNGITYRRLTLWLPHGLAKDASLTNLKNAIQLCCLVDPFGSLESSSNCASQAYDLSRPYPAVLSMRLPALNPRQRCVVRVKADAKVKDAFGLPLQSSQNVWWSLDLDPAYTGPSVRQNFALAPLVPSSMQVALLEPAPGPLTWPWVSRGVPEQSVKQVQAVSVPVGASTNSKSSSSGLLERAISGVLTGFAGAAGSLMSSAGVKLARKDATWPTFQSLTLPGQPGVSLVGSCCRQVSWPQPHDVLSSSVMVVQSDLQAAFVEQQGQLMVWVTTTQGQSKPVKGATVQVYNSAYGKDAATPGPTCTTALDGSCVIDLVAAKAQQQKAASNAAFQPLEESGAYTAVITAEGHGPLVVPEVPNSGRYRNSRAGKEYVATLVLDRKLVKPGDDLHVTAYIQRKDGAQLKIAEDLTSVLFQVTPSFDRGSPGNARNSPSSRVPTRIEAKVDTKYGTAHAVIPVPRNATPANYNLQLWTGAPVGAGANSISVPVAMPRPAVNKAAPANAPAAASNAPRSGATKPAVAAVSSAAPANAQAVGSQPGSNKREAGVVRPPIAVMPTPKQLMGGVPSNGPTKPVGVTHPAPSGTLEPHLKALAVAANDTADAAVSGGQSQRRLQQEGEDPEGSTDDVEPVEAEVELITPDPADSEPAVLEPAVAEPALPSTPSSLGSAGSQGSSDAGMPMPTTVPASQPGSPPSQPVGTNIAYTTFTVGDPRPPTASLALSTASSWVKPDGAVSVSVTTRSYVGSDVSGAEVTLKWSTGKADGELALKTNASGVAIGTVELSKLPAANRSEPGATLTIKATWIGPTREPLMQSKTVKIAGGPVRVELQRTLLTDVPGVMFGVVADAFSNEDGSPVKGAMVEVTIAPRNGSASLANCSAAQRSTLAQQKCSIKSGDPAAATACQLMLPCTGEFDLKGCISGSGSGSGNSSGSGCSKPIRLGRNMTSWVAAPWSTGPGQIRLLADKQNVSLGGDVALTLQNPFWGPTSALVVWGNGVEREHYHLEQVPPGVSTIMIQELGPECQGGCNVVVTLAVARPQGLSATSTARNATGNSTGNTTGNAASPPVSTRTPAPQGDKGNASAPRSAPPKAPGNSPPRGLTGSGTPRTNPRTQAAGGTTKSAPTFNTANTVRTFSTIWPFNIRVFNGPEPSTNRRVGLFGRSNNNNNRMLRRSVALQERGNAAGSPGSRAGLPDIPRSKLYDPYAPLTMSAEVSLQMSDTSKLSVDVSVAGQSKDAAGVAVLAPQSRQGSITVSVKDAAGAAVPSAEVTLVVVDKAVLDLMPYELQDVSDSMQPKLRASFGLLHLNTMRVTRAAINATFSTLQRRLTSVDPWLPVDTQVTPLEGLGALDSDTTWLPPAAAVDVPDDVYLRSYTTALTPMPTRPCPVGEVNCPRPMIAHSHVHSNAATIVASDAAAEMMPAPAPMAAAMPRSMNAMAKSTNAENSAGASSNAAGGRSAGPSAAAAGAQLRLQQAFKVTALFKVAQTGPDGKATVKFPAPDNLGRFVVRAYVAAPKAAVKTASSSSSSGVVYGAGESQLIVRRTVSMVPSLPRQVRVGDAFTAGVLVEAPGTVAEVAVTITASMQQPGAAGSSSNSSSKALRLRGEDSRTVMLSPGKPQQEVRFDFTADSIGTQNITFAATAGASAGGSGVLGARRGLRALLQWRPAAGGDATAAAGPAAAGAVADQVQLQVPVHGKQGAVAIATSFAVRGSSDGRNWQEGMVLPRAERGSGSIDLIAGVGSLPAIQAAYTGLAQQGLESSRCPPSSQAVALALLPSYLSLYQQPGASASGALTAQQLQLTQASAAAVNGKLTHDRFGLLSVEPSCLYPGSAGPERADVTLNAWAAWLAEQALNGAAVGGSGGRNAGALSAAWGSVQGAAKTWRKALETQLVADAVSARQGSRHTPPAAYSDLETLSWARLVLGPTWAPTVTTPQNAAANARDVSAEVKKDLSMQRLTAAAFAGNLTVGGQARVGLALLRDPKAAMGSYGGKQLSAAAAVQRISSRLTSSIRVGGRTAYIATGEGQRSAAGLSDQSLALTFLVDANVDNPLIQKLAAWVAQGAAPPPLFYAAMCVSSSPWDALLRSQALTSYDSSTANLTPDLKVTVNAQPQPSLTGKRAPVTLLSAGFTPQAAGKLANSSTGWDEVPPNSTLVVSAQGSGEVSVAAALNFTPADLLPFPTYRGLWVQRVLLLEQSGSAGSSSSAAVDAGLGLGKIVTMAVQVTSPDDQADVTVEVLMPGGLEPLDPNVFKDPDAATICSSGDDETPLTGSNSGGGRIQRSGNMIAMDVPMTMPIADMKFAGGRSFWRPIWPMCPLQTTAPDRVTFRFGYMRAGTHTMRFKAVAATSGEFVLPPVKAFVQQQPEVMGLSPAGSLTVCSKASEGCAAAGQASQAAVPAKACPKDCNSNGACNLATGVCVCDSGFGGASCGDIATY